MPMLDRGVPRLDGKVMFHDLPRDSTNVGWRPSEEAGILVEE